MTFLPGLSRSISRILSRVWRAGLRAVVMGAQFFEAGGGVADQDPGNLADDAGDRDDGFLLAALAADAAVQGAQPGIGARGGHRGLSEPAADVPVALAGAAGPCGFPGLHGARGQAGPGSGVPGDGEYRRVGAELGDDDLGVALADPGNLIQPLRQRQQRTAVLVRVHPDDKWGKRPTGGDPLSFAAEIDFPGLGKVCRELTEANDRDDYKDRFGWLDSIRPIYDPQLLKSIEEDLVLQLLVGDFINLDLAPPEIVDWSRVTGFQYHFDYRQNFIRPELQLSIYLSNLRYHENEDDYVNVEYFRRKSIRALDADGTEIYRWSVWRCLTGEFEVNAATYVIDEGAIFEVSSDYLSVLNEDLSRMPLQEDLAWPIATESMNEDSFNRKSAAALAPALLMDKKLVNSRMQTTPIEVCDVLTANRQLIHAKLKFGSRDLSHLFS